jgi:hypothetical protein
MIWLGAYFQALTLGHTSCPLVDICVPAWVRSGVLKWPQNEKKTGQKLVFWLFWTIPSTARDLMIWLRAYF